MLVDRKKILKRAVAWNDRILLTPSHPSRGQKLLRQACRSGREGIIGKQLQSRYVGDRSGTIFKISKSRQIYVFATLEPSIAAYHLAFGPEDYLYVTGPTTSSFDVVYRISKAGEGALVPAPDLTAVGAGCF